MSVGKGGKPGKAGIPGIAAPPGMPGKPGRALGCGEGLEVGRFERIQKKYDPSIPSKIE